MIRHTFLVLGMLLVPSLVFSACPAAPVGSNQDRVIQMVAGGDNVTQMGSQQGTNATEEGAVVYDDTQNTLVVCDGTNWVTLGGSDRITSGTTSFVAVSGTSFVSLTQAGVQTGWFDPQRGLVTLGVSATGAISATSAYFTSQVTSRAFNAGSATTFNWNNGNNQYTSATCGAFTFSNMLDGGTYNLVVTAATSGLCIFTHAGLILRYPTGYGATTASTHTVFTFIRMGTEVYVTAVRGLI